MFKVGDCDISDANLLNNFGYSEVRHTSTPTSVSQSSVICLTLNNITQRSDSHSHLCLIEKNLHYEVIHLSHLALPAELSVLDSHT